ncbi:MAG: branched-chain amino acid ABC transporter substrate-binding protein [Solirubrobacteraceae bacterium]|nr:branched-chain amino acid ABC transporter substrate-binding protein [Solirubrobacteraceae bacterium]
MSRVVAVLLALLAMLVAGCGSSDDDPPRPDDGVVGSRTLTVYASVPLQGEMRQESKDAVNAMKLALSDAGGRVGAFTINLAVLDDASAEAGGWDRDRTLDNATTAARDRNAIAVIGEWDSDASALSIPILNEAEMLQVSPASTYVGLTRRGGVSKGEPEKYYPSGRRTFARVVPPDDLQGRVLVEQLRERGARTVFLAHDRSLYGKGLVAQVRKAAEAARIEVVGDEALDPAAEEYTSLAANVRRSEADAFMFGGSVRNGAVQVFRDVAAGNPNLPLFGGDALAVESFAGVVGERAARNIVLTSPATAADTYSPEGERFAKQFAEQFGRPPTPMAIYAYAAMDAVMSAVRAAGELGNDRDAVTEQMLALDMKDSVLGPFTINREGDTSREQYGIWRIAGGRLRGGEPVEAPR